MQRIPCKPHGDVRLRRGMTLEDRGSHRTSKVPSSPVIVAKENSRHGPKHGRDFRVESVPCSRHPTSVGGKSNKDNSVNIAQLWNMSKKTIIALGRA